MAAEALPNSSWHPALMPDHESPTKLSPQLEPQPSAGTSPDSLHNGTPLEQDPEPFHLDEQSESTGINNSNTVRIDPLPGHLGDEGGAWLTMEQSVGRAPSKHASSMSFARTVSHEVSFADGDEDEADWTLQRTDTDPFKFMAPSDRSNTFPVPAPIVPNGAVEQPLPANQAMEAFGESEDQDWELGDDGEDLSPSQGEQDQQSLPSGAGPSESRHGPTRSMGGDAQPNEDDAAETRFEEGMPLLAGSDSHRAESTTTQKKQGPDLFAEDEPNDDDFFGQIGNSAPSDEPPIQPLERKSTSQVMGDLSTEPPSRQNTFGTLQEDDEPPSDAANESTAQAPTRGGHRRTKTQDLKAKWEAALMDDEDDDLLLDDDEEENKDLDTAGFLGSDDEGLLENDGGEPAPAPQQPASRQTSSSNPYAPQSYQQPATVPAHSSQQSATGSYFNPPAPANAFAGGQQYGRPPLPGSDQPKAQSFADKAKGGYSSPYDLPTDIVASVPKPRKRPSVQQMYAPSSAAQQAPPPGPPNMSAPPPLPPQSNSRPQSSHESPGGASLTQKPSTTSLRSKGSFFEDLPIAPKARPTSRQSYRAQSPVQQQPGPPQGPPQGPPREPSLGPSPLGQSTRSQPSSDPSGIPNLVPPERVSPYAALQSGSGHIPPPSGNSSRYSPAPGQAPATGAVPPPGGTRYSPAPPQVPRQASYSPSRTPSTTTPPVLPHQPRTSSPLAHFESSSLRPHAEGFERRSSSSSFEPRLNRVPSLPPTREVDEEEDHSGDGAPLGTRHSSAESKYAPSAVTRQTPPPPGMPRYASSPLSPPKRATPNYAPQASQQPQAAQAGFVPPPRAQTHSPGASAPTTQASATNHIPRPSSTQSHATPEATKSTRQPPYANHSRVRGQSITMTMVAPTDGREQDPLQRWKGVPLFTWGAGGAVVTSFPRSIPRYSMGSSTPTVTRTPGEVKLQNIRDIDTLPERLINFPGPLKGKSKKKETIAWLASGIEILEKELPDLSFHSELSTEVKRSFERLLLWKILRVFVENDGVLEGKANVDKAVRDILSPEANSSDDAHAGASVTAMQADAVDAGSMEAIRASLFKGDRESAVWSAVDKRLWGHAMLIANTVSPDLYKQVTQEFVRKEVNYQGHSNESMAALYKILSGNYEDCVDELVPSHARAGFQLLSTTGAASGPAKDAMDGLDKWRETLALVLNNRSQGDVQGLKALGSLLASYGRAEAAHVCFIFSKAASICGGLDDPTADFVLLGSDHKQQSSHFGKETEALQLSEVFEYGLSLAGAVGGLPHLAAYKFQHALTLAEHGQRDKALQYCESIAAAISSQTKRSPYYNPYVAAGVDDLIARLKQVPKGESGSWISKPSMGKVSDSMWNKFNKFVAGDDEQQGAPGADGSPFSHIGGGTPTISRSPSTNNFETYGAAAPAYGMVASPPAAAMPSKYAPTSASPYQPSSQYAPAPVGQGQPGAPQEASYPAHGHNSYAPTSGYQPSEPSGEMPASPNYGGYQPHVQPQSPNMPGSSGAQQGPAETQGAYNPPDYGYAPPQDFSATRQEDNHVDEPRSGGYEPPAQQSYGYEPPSYQPDFTADNDEDTKPKRGMMDDGDDAPRPSSQQSKADKDRENEEMFRKAAEEDAKRAEAEKANKKGWGLSGWFGGKKPASPKPGESPKKPVRANLGEASSFVYDPDLKRWVNKKPGAENTPAKTATPPPPRAGPPGPRSMSGTPPPPMSTPPPMRSASGGPPPRSIPSSNTLPSLKAPASNDNLSMPPPSAPMARSVSSQSAGAPPSAPPSRPGTSMSNASSIDDLIGAAAPRKPGQKKARKSGRYVDVMAK
ncbi:SEC16 protein [Emericellopsis atlantica]|uniref:Protein transport protein sec16 n=1 Tax=Emericellopsis atlantica TaxID=2614577 RepID=A0A9P8CM47_9HYPO|nr:SEC16 protein [Emericellopsis atlantica]KAG9252329.1 SEC16 protein [Emericellopsis atlantica]